MSEESNYWKSFWEGRRLVSRRTLLRTGALTGLGLAAGGSLVGCSDQSKSEPRAGVTPQAKEEPQYGGVLTHAIAGDPPDFDLIASSTYMNLYPLAPCYNNLVMMDPLDDTKVIGDLAEKIDISPDGKAYTFSLVKNAKFHDGKACTSEDVKFTFDITRDPPKGQVSPRKGTLAAVDKIEAPDPYTVRFVLSRPNPSLLENIAQGFNVIYPKHVYQEKGNMKKDVVGTGPFKLKEYVRGNYVELVKNPDYHVKGRPYLDGMKFYTIPDPGTQLANFRTGQIQVHMTIRTEDASVAEKEFSDKVVVQTSSGIGHHAVAFNVKKKPWDDIRVRQAASMAVDREEAVKVLEMGAASVGGILPPRGKWALPSTELEKLPGYGKDKAANIATAKKLLAEAGFPNGFACTLLTRKGSDFEPVSIFLKDQLAKVGIDAKLDVQETATAYETLNARAFDLCPWVFGTGIDDPDAMFGEFQLCNAERNYSGYCDNEVEALFDKQSQTVNVDERKKIVNELERKALLTFARISVAWRWEFAGLSRRVRNYKLHAVEKNNVRLQDVWLAKS